MTILLHDNFNGTEPLNGHVPDVNALGAGGTWSDGGNGVLSGGLLSPTSGVPGAYAVGLLFASPGQGFVGGGVKLSFQWTPYGNPGDFLSATYPIGINFECATVWMTVTSGVASVAFSSGGESEVVSAPFVSGTTYLCEVTVDSGQQVFNFMGHSVTLNAAIDLSALTVQPIYLNQYTLSSGAPGSGLDFIKVEEWAGSFWTNLRNAKEVA